MKHECKTMKEVSGSIQQFNDRVRDATAVRFLDAQLHDSPDDKGICFTVLFYGKKKKELITQGFGFRFLHCPCCGEKIDKK